MLVALTEKDLIISMLSMNICVGFSELGMSEKRELAAAYLKLWKYVQHSDSPEAACAAHYVERMQSILEGNYVV